MMLFDRCFIGVVLVLSCAPLLSGPASAGPPEAPTINLRVVAGEKVLANGKHEYTLEEFPDRIAAAIKRYEDVDIPSKSVTIHIDGDEAATCGQIRQVMRMCLELGVEKFQLPFDPPLELVIQPAAPAIRAIDERLLPPMRLRLKAKENGSLESIRLDQRVLPSMAEVQRELITRIGDERGPGSIAESLELEIEADDGLHWRHVGQAYAAAAGHKSPRGEFVSLVKNIQPLPIVAGGKVEEIEEIEEVELIEDIELIEEIELKPVVPLEDIEPVELEGAAVEVEQGVDDDSPQPTPLIQSLTAEQRRELAKKFGGSDASEAAVAAALKWIASRQSADGGWNFDHNQSISELECPNPGSAARARNAATGLALLAFLGSNQTHKDGDYKKEVYAGLAFLIKNMKVKENTGSWHEPEGSMYGHGYAALAICEAYARTQDKELLAPAQLAVNYIVFAQDPVGGGWRYSPKQAGDTSVTTVQVMSLRHARDAKLKVPKTVLTGTVKFLDSVQSGEDGSRYGYTTPGTGSATTAMGLLCRTHLGWKRDVDGLQAGVDFLDKNGPSEGNMYYNYYATQTMFQYGGEPWKRWNAKMRDALVESQSKDGVTAGSWFFKVRDHGSERGGRLYCTALACLTLEVYYREGRVFDKLEPM